MKDGRWRMEKGGTCGGESFGSRDGSCPFSPPSYSPATYVSRNTSFCEKGDPGSGLAS